MGILGDEQCRIAGYFQPYTADISVHQPGPGGCNILGEGGVRRVRSGGVRRNEGLEGRRG